MTSKQREYLSKLHNFKWYISGKYYGKCFSEVVQQKNYWEKATASLPLDNKTVKLFDTYLELLGKCCWECRGSGEMYIGEGDTGECIWCQPWLMVKQEDSEDEEG